MGAKQFCQDLSKLCRAREEAEERQAEEKKRAVASARAVFKKELAEQIAERQAAREGKKVELACEETAMEAFHQVCSPSSKTFPLLSKQAQTPA